MRPDDLNELTARINAALAESATEVGSDARAADAPIEFAVPLEGMAAHCVNHECTRQALTDPAVQRIGGREFRMEIVKGPEPDFDQLILIRAEGVENPTPRPSWTSDRPDDPGSPKRGEPTPGNPPPLRASPQMTPMAGEPQRVVVAGEQVPPKATADGGVVAEAEPAAPARPVE